MGQKNGTASSAASKKGYQIQSLITKGNCLLTLMFCKRFMALHSDLLGHCVLLLPLNCRAPWSLSISVSQILTTEEFISCQRKYSLK